MRFGLIFAAFIIAFGLANYITMRTLLKLHPRRRVWIFAAVVAGNLMWLCFPLLRTLTPAGRITRAVFGPPWFAWNVFALCYAVLVPIWRSRWLSRAYIIVVTIATIAGMIQALVPLRV